MGKRPTFDARAVNSYGRLLEAQSAVAQARQHGVQVFLDHAWRLRVIGWGPVSIMQGLWTNYDTIGALLEFHNEREIELRYTARIRTGAHWRRGDRENIH